MTRAFLSTARSLLASAAVLTLAPLPSMQCRAATGDASLRAAIVLNIIRFVDFGQNNPPGSLLLCVNRASGTARAMAALEGERVGARRVVPRMSDLRDTSGCDVVYLGDNRAAIVRVRRAGVLVIADGEGVLEAGGTIGLVGSGNRIRFEASTRAARESGIRLSSKLLRLAARVR